MRYDYAPWEYEAGDHMSNFNPATGTLFFPSNSPYGRGLVKNDKNDWGPRLGLAYHVKPNWVVRTGYGRFYQLFERLSACQMKAVVPGGSLPGNVGEPHGAHSPWPWSIPLVARDVSTKPELKGHFDRRYPDFRGSTIGQTNCGRMSFLTNSMSLAEARQQHEGNELPQFVILRVGNDHTAGTVPGMPTPEALVADNDLAVGRVVEALSQPSLLGRHGHLCS